MKLTQLHLNLYYQIKQDQESFDPILDAIIMECPEDRKSFSVNSSKTSTWSAKEAAS